MNKGWKKYHNLNRVYYIIDKNEFQLLYNKHGREYCKKYYNITSYKFYDLLNKFNIKLKDEKQTTIDIKQLKIMYIERNMDVKDIAKKLNISSVYLYTILKRNNIIKRRNIKTNKHITKEMMIQVYNNSKNYKEAARKLNVSLSWFGRHMKKFDLKPRLNPKGISRSPKNIKCFIDDTGRKFIYMPNHKRVIGNYVANAILVMEQNIGRQLNEKEIVHHKDLNPSNDNINNLLLLKNRSEHSKIHSKIYKNNEVN